MKTIRRRQTIASDAHRVLSLLGTEMVSLSPNSEGLIVSPYFQRPRLQGISSGRNTNHSLRMLTLFVCGYTGDGPHSVGVEVDVVSDVITTFGNGEFTLAVTPTSTPADIEALTVSTVQTFVTGLGYGTFDSVVWLCPKPTSLGSPSSYQTIVTQTGTAAPAVSGSLSPVSTYPAGTTFTWARTGAGVYTLTASAAVFNTSGKTGVFLGALNNLNGSWKAVVTSSTVITITTAIGSLLGLGLLGFTATNTDAILSQTIVYVQTYA